MLGFNNIPNKISNNNNTNSNNSSNNSLSGQTRLSQVYKIHNSNNGSKFKHNSSSKTSHKDKIVAHLSLKNLPRDLFEANFSLMSINYKINLT